MRNPASSGKRSASVLLCDTAVCFLQAHEIGTNVCDPNIHRTPPEVDFESVRFPENLRLGTIQVCSLMLDFQRDNTVHSWFCDVCK